MGPSLWSKLRASAAIVFCAVGSPRGLHALPGRVELGGVDSLAPRGTAAAGAGLPAQRNVRRRLSSVSPRPRPWRGAAAGPGLIRSWCRHDTIAGQEGQVGKQGREPEPGPGALEQLHPQPLVTAEVP